MARSRTTMPKREPRRKPKKAAVQKRKRMEDVPLQAMSVDQFCHAHGVNRDTFYSLLKKGEAPECMRLGRRRLVSFEAAARWRAQREAASAATTEVAA
jgi:predicted DNA-binding transcriptional regulator AlpA